ncbi:unnamed protein product [Penicillium viridicatum]
MEPRSTHGIRAPRSLDCTDGGHISKSRRLDRFRVSREPRRLPESASEQLKSDIFQYPNIGITAPRQDEGLQLAQGAARRPESQRSHSMPIAVHSQNAGGIQNVSHATKKQEQVQASWHTRNEEIINQNVEMVGGGADTQEEKPHAMFRQPDTHAITEEQLINEVRGIYTGLVMVEKKCIEIDRQQAPTLRGEEDTGGDQALLGPGYHHCGG